MDCGQSSGNYFLNWYDKNVILAVKLTFVHRRGAKIVFEMRELRMNQQSGAEVLIESRAIFYLFL